TGRSAGSRPTEHEEPRRSGALPPELRSPPLVVLADDLAPTAGRPADAAPARPEDQREQRADRADDEKDPADRVEVEAVRRDVHRPDEHGPDRDQDHAHTNAHVFSFRLLQGKNVRTAQTDTALSLLQERRAFLCRLEPDRALETLDEAEPFLRDRGVLTRTT